MAATSYYRHLGRYLQFFILALLCRSGLAFSATVVSPLPSPTTPVTHPRPVTLSRGLASHQRVALGFEANRGQTDGQVQFVARGRGYTLFLTSQEAVFALQSSVTESQRQPASPLSTAVVRLRLLHANTTPVT